MYNINAPLFPIIKPQAQVSVFFFLSFFVFLRDLKGSESQTSTGRNINSNEANGINPKEKQKKKI